ncbi:MAG: hypothetical protein HQL56_05620 [Magnetococcales bacterium]|nr:hypothetical protein [Magnetococcales bacterium]
MSDPVCIPFNRGLVSAEEFGKNAFVIDPMKTTPDIEFELGTILCDANCTRWVYVHASAAIMRYQAVGIDENIKAAPLTRETAEEAWGIGFAQTDFADNDFGWVAVESSRIYGLVQPHCPSGKALYTSDKPGVLGKESRGQAKIYGAEATRSTFKTEAAVPLIFTGPRTAPF